MKKLFNLKSNITAVLGALLCVALWGTAFPLIKLGYARFSIEQGDIGSKLVFAGYRFALAGALVFVLGLIIYRKPALPKKGDLLPIASLGLVQTALQYLFAYIGVGFTTAANTSILTGTASIFSVLMAAVLIKSDRMTFLKALGCVVGLAGIAIVNINDFSLDSEYFVGDIIVLLSALSGAAGNIITKKISGGRDAVTITAWQLFIGGAALIIAGLLLGGGIDPLNTGGGIILLWLSAVSAVSFLLWTALLRYHPVSKITIFTMLVPIFGTLWSWILLGESVFSLTSVLSLLLIVAGIVLINIRGIQK